MKNHFIILLISSVIFASCGDPAPVEVKLDKFDITFSAVASNTGKAPEFKELGYDNQLSRYEFRIGKRRVKLVEIEESIYPGNVETLSAAISGTEKFKAMEKGEGYADGTVSYANGAFGVIYSKEGSSGKVVKDYIMCYSKGGRYFRMTPIFNSDLEDLAQQLAAVESMK